MSYRELTMIDVKELLRRWAAQHSNRSIARGARLDRATVARYVAIAEQLALPRDRDLTEAEIHEVAQRVQARLEAIERKRRVSIGSWLPNPCATSAR